MSNINPNYPGDGVLIESAPLRQQFATAKAEIENLQSQINSLSGSTGLYVLKANNLSDVVSAATARANLGIVDESFEVVTASRAVQASETNKTFLTTGAAGEVLLTLPAAQAGLKFGGYVDAAQFLTMDAAGTDVIRNGVDVTSAGGSLQANVIGSYIYLRCLKNGVWTVTNITGEWSIA